MSRPTFERSPTLMSAADTVLLIVDVQEKLIRLIRDHATIVWNIERLIEGAAALGVSVLATEQYPQGLGGTVPELAHKIAAIRSKVSFSCAGCVELCDDLLKLGVSKALVVGIESHVCVQQTVLDLLASGLAVYVAVDAVGSRGKSDRDTALRRLDSAGATLTTTESALFEWCEVSGTPEFKIISQLIQQEPPE